MDVFKESSNGKRASERESILNNIKDESDGKRYVKTSLYH